MKTRWLLKLWDGTEVSQQVHGLSDAVRGYYWDDIVSIRVTNKNGIDQAWCETALSEACRRAERAANVADKCVWNSVVDGLWALYIKIKKKKIKECKIL